jgi:5-methylcytosine-specific restriction endonuclease McrA
VAAQVTDHIVALRDGGARLDPRNHQSLCYRCNVLKSVPR